MEFLSAVGKETYLSKVIEGIFPSLALQEWCNDWYANVRNQLLMTESEILIPGSIATL
jgi:hypothetical protein